jgi:hypothetical protein
MVARDEHRPIRKPSRGELPLRWMDIHRPFTHPKHRAHCSPMLTAPQHERKDYIAANSLKKSRHGLSGCTTSILHTFGVRPQVERRGPH